MNFADLVPLSEPSGLSDPKATKTALHLRDLSDSARKISYHFSNNRESYTDAHKASEIQRSLSSELLASRAALLRKTYGLPESLLERDPHDTLTRAALSPKIRLDDARDMADKLGFVIMPFEYMNKKAYSEENWETKQSIQEFERLGSFGFQIYALAPVSYYDPNLHLKAKEDRPIHASRLVEQAFMAISMVMPMLRSLNEDVGQHHSRLREMDSRQRKLEAEMVNMAARIDQLQKSVERSYREMVAAKEAAVKEAERAAARAAQFVALDPMMLAFSNNVLNDEFAIVGPCWGPDFHQAVVRSFGFSKITGQRKRIEQAWR